MIRTVLKSEGKSVTLQLPDDLIGKMIEVIAFSIESTHTAIKDQITIEDSATIFKIK